VVVIKFYYFFNSSSGLPFYRKAEEEIQDSITEDEGSYCSFCPEGGSVSGCF